MTEDLGVDMIIAQCLYCGMQRFGECEEDAVEKLKTHRCITSLSDKKLGKILERILTE